MSYAEDFFKRLVKESKDFTANLDVGGMYVHANDRVLFVVDSFAVHVVYYGVLKNLKNTSKALSRLYDTPVKIKVLEGTMYIEINGKTLASSHSDYCLVLPHTGGKTVEELQRGLDLIWDTTHC